MIYLHGKNYLKRSAGGEICEVGLSKLEIDQGLL